MTMFMKQKEKTNKKGVLSIAEAAPVGDASPAGSRFYISPAFEITRVQTEGCFCASYQPKPKAKEWGWEDADEAINGGEIVF